jgi:hypothetical protein
MLHHQELTSASQLHATGRGLVHLGHLIRPHTHEQLRSKRCCSSLQEGRPKLNECKIFNYGMSRLINLEH